MVCGAKEFLPYKCSYCGGVFCGEHRLPEKHACTYGVREIIITEKMMKEIEAKKAEPVPNVRVIFQNPLASPTPGVNPELDKVIRETLMELQELYPGCADNLTLALAKPDSVRTEYGREWLAVAMRNGERILLNEDKWVMPFALLSEDARDSIIHEFGHFVFWKLDYIEVNEWNRIWEEYKTDDSLTSIATSDRYALKNAEEGFAEAFAAIEGFKYTSVNRTDPLFFGCKKLAGNHRSRHFDDEPKRTPDASDAKSLVTEKVVVMGKFNNIDRPLVEIYGLVNKADKEELSELKKHLGAVEDILVKIDNRRG